MDWVLLGVAAVVALVAAALILMLTAPSGAEEPPAPPVDSVDADGDRRPVGDRPDSQGAGEHTDASGP